MLEPYPNPILPTFSTTVQLPADSLKHYFRNKNCCHVEKTRLARHGDFFPVEAGAGPLSVQSFRHSESPSSKISYARLICFSFSSAFC